jgi:acyl-CoA dehydrogenase
MRCIGIAERALELMCRRVTDRVAFGRPLAEQGVIREWIADSRMEIEQARLLTFKAAWLMDTVGNKGAAVEISSIKVVVPNMALRGRPLHRPGVSDIQAHGGRDGVPGRSRRLPARVVMYAGSARPAPRSPTGPTRCHRRQVAARQRADEVQRPHRPASSPAASS